MEPVGEGFIISNKIRKAVYMEIASGEHSLNNIAKKHHLLPSLVQNAITEIKDGGLIEETSEGYILTEHGKKVHAKIRSHESI